jgi:hypothetical protein
MNDVVDKNVLPVLYREKANKYKDERKKFILSTLYEDECVLSYTYTMYCYPSHDVMWLYYQTLHGRVNMKKFRASNTLRWNCESAI